MYNKTIMTILEKIKDGKIDNLSLVFLCVTGIVILYMVLSLVFLKTIDLPFSIKNYDQIIKKDQLFTNIKDFQTNGALLTSTSNDPWIETFLNTRTTIKKLRIDISFLSIPEENAQVFYASKEDSYSEEKSIKFNLVKGSNIIQLPSSIQVDKLRLDLVSTEGVSITPEKVLINPSNTSVFWIVFWIITILYILVLFDRRNV
jgi:hypothetical protein